MITHKNPTWTRVCCLDDLLPGVGACARVEGSQVALFRLPDDRVFAIANRDPLGGANVLSRGIIGDFETKPFVASPLYKQRFDLATGVCLDQAGTAVPTFEVRIEHGAVWVGKTGTTG